ncbi:MAG: CoA transferase [Chloroflexi bacterium]|nr:CoA transferase [Chloroflexota bacterium]
MSRQALSWLKVVEYGDFVSAPLCAKLMADLGAEVIKIEAPPLGDKARRHGPFPGDIPHAERSGLFLNLNTNKLGVTLDLRTFTGKNILKELLKTADVFVQNSPPPVMRELGLDYDSLGGVNPRLIVTAITPYGLTGPYRDYKGYDINCSALSGVSETIGRPDREPLTAPLFQCDQQAGLGAAGGTFVALLARDVTGKGQLVDISTVDVMTTVHVGSHLMTHAFDGVNELRTREPRLQNYPTGLHRCKDGYICMIAPQVAQWIRFLEVMGTPEWSKLPRYRDRRAMANQYRAEVDALLEPWLMEHTKEEIFEICRKNAIPFTPVYNVEELVNSPQLEYRSFFPQVTHAEAGTIKQAGWPFLFSETPWKLERPAPLLGQHNEEIYCGRLGYSKGDLAQLRRSGII